MQHDATILHDSRIATTFDVRVERDVVRGSGEQGDARRAALRNHGEVRIGRVEHQDPLLRQHSLDDALRISEVIEGLDSVLAEVVLCDVGDDRRVRSAHRKPAS